MLYSEETWFTVYHLFQAEIMERRELWKWKIHCFLSMGIKNVIFVFCYVGEELGLADMTETFLTCCLLVRWGFIGSDARGLFPWPADLYMRSPAWVLDTWLTVQLLESLYSHFILRKQLRVSSGIRPWDWQQGPLRLLGFREAGTGPRLIHPVGSECSWSPSCVQALGTEQWIKETGSVFMGLSFQRGGGR